MPIKEIKTREEVVKTFDFITHFYDNLKKENYVSSALKMMENGYKMAAVFDEKELDILGLCGFRFIEKLHYGTTLEIEDFAIDPKNSSGKIGKILLDFIETQATTFGCKNIIGNLATKRVESQKIFTNGKFFLDEFLFRKTL
jgi:GNAT superfamily N-acetyltransferase